MSEKKRETKPKEANVKKLEAFLSKLKENEQSGK